MSCRVESLALVISPLYALRFVWLRIAEATDSPLDVTSTELAVPGMLYSREERLAASFFQGPGESCDIKGDGNGVTSVRALSMGLEKAELGADPKFELEPTL